MKMEQGRCLLQQSLSVAVWCMKQEVILPTQALLRQNHCNFIPAQYSLTSSFKLLMSVPATHVIPHSTQGLQDSTFQSKATYTDGTNPVTMTLAPSCGFHQRRAFIWGWTGHSACTAEVSPLSHSQHRTVCFEKTRQEFFYIYFFVCKNGRR